MSDTQVSTNTGRAIHLGSIYIWDDISDERFDEFRNALVLDINKVVSKLRAELESELPAEESKEKTPTPKKRKEKKS